MAMLDLISAMNIFILESPIEHYLRMEQMNMLFALFSAMQAVSTYPFLGPDS